MHQAGLRWVSFLTSHTWVRHESGQPRMSSHLFLHLSTVTPSPLTFHEVVPTCDLRECPSEVAAHHARTSSRRKAARVGLARHVFPPHPFLHLSLVMDRGLVWGRVPSDSRPQYVLYLDASSRIPGYITAAPSLSSSSTNLSSPPVDLITRTIRSLLVHRHHSRRCHCHCRLIFFIVSVPSTASRTSPNHTSHEDLVRSIFAVFSSSTNIQP